MLTLRSTFIDTPIGVLRLCASERGITELEFVEKRGKDDDAYAHLNAARMQLAEYFAGERRTFHDLPLAFIGTAFRQDVWAQVLQVPFGTTLTYGQIAEKMGKRGGARAVGGAVGMNPLCIIVPCHRILPANGSLGGFAWGEDRKKWLLAHESKRVQQASAIA